MKTLPNNAFGISIFLTILLLAAIVPFSVSFWLIGMVAPWWVSVPLSLLVSIVVFLIVVKFPKP